jgi:hypothetical protein
MAPSFATGGAKYGGDGQRHDSQPKLGEKCSIAFRNFVEFHGTTKPGNNALGGI